MEKKNVLVAGIGQPNYLFQLYSQITPKLPKLSFSSINLRDLDKDEIRTEAEVIFKHNHEYYPEKVNKLWLFRFIPAIISSRYFWKDQRILFANQGVNFFKFSLSLAFQHLKAKSFACFIEEKTNTDIIHLHFPSHKYLLFLKYINVNYKIIYTFWGSDIYRIRQWRTHEIQKELLYQSDLITCTTPEMRFNILCRYGFNLFSKIKVVQFLHQEQYYRIVDNLLLEDQWREPFRKKFFFPKEKELILFGHNAHFENNHISFLEVLSELPENILQKYHFIFPMTYGGDKNGAYINEIRNKAQEININFSILEDYMDWSSIAKLKILCNYYIHAPITDGLSAFLTEYFYTNNMAIVADWLPYKTFDDYGLSYAKFSSFPDLKEILLRLPIEKKRIGDNLLKNKKIIEIKYNLDHMAKKWIEIFNELN